MNVKRLVCLIALVAGAGLGACAANLPEGYSRLKWITATGTQYIDTGYYPTSSDTVLLELCLSQVGSLAGLFDARDNTATHRFTALLLSAGEIRVDRGIGAASMRSGYTTLVTGKDYLFEADFDRGAFLLNGSTLVGSMGDFYEETMVNSLVVLGLRAQTTGVPGNLAKGRLYSFRVKDAAGNLKVDMVPCRSPSNEVGMYDFAAAANGRPAFYGSAVAGAPFEAGDPAVSVVVESYDEALGRAIVSVPQTDRKTILAVLQGPTDCGTNLSGWTNCLSVVPVPAGTDRVAVEVPSLVDVTKDAVRFALFNGDDALPDDVFPLATLNSSGTQWLDTGLAADSSMTVRMLVEQPKKDYLVTFGIANQYYMFRNTQGLWYSWFADPVMVECPDIHDGAAHLLEFGPAGGFVDGTQRIPAFQTTGSTSQTIPVYGRRASDTLVNNLVTANMHWMRVERNGETIMDLRPCMKDGVAQMYDTIGDRFLTNQGTGAFRPGMPSCLGMSGTLSDVLAHDVRSVSVASVDRATGTVALAFSAGATAKDLFAAHAVSEPDAATGNFDSYAFLGTIPADCTATNCTVPSLCWHQGVVRFVLARQAPERMRTMELMLCDYVSAGGASYLDTGYFPNNTDTVAMRVRLEEQSAAFGFFDARNVDTSKRFTALMESTSSMNVRVDKGNGAAGMKYSSKKMTWNTDYDLVADFNGGTFCVNDETWISPLATATEETMPCTLIALGFRAQTTGVPGNFAKGRLYSFTVTDKSGDAKVDLVPCVRHGVAQMYDRVRGCYLASEGTEPFQAGGELRYGAVRARESMSGSVSVGPGVSFKIDAHAWTVAVTLGDGCEGGRLFAACGREDKGERISNWDYVAPLGGMSAGERTATFNLPAAWLGNRMNVFRVFYATAESRCPFDYAVETLNSTGTQWIETGIAPNSSTTVRMLIALPNSRELMPPFGIANQYFMFRNGEGLWYGWFGTAQMASCADFHDGVPRIQEFGPAGGFVGGEQKIGAFSSGGETSLTMTLFGRRQDATTVNKLDTANIYWFTVEKRGRTIMDLQPCVKDGVAQMYDRVTGHFFANQGEGAFSTGRALAGGVGVEDREIISCSEPDLLVRGLVVIIR